MTLALVLVAAGLLLAFLEILVPSFGVLGLLAGGCLLSAVYAGFRESAGAGAGVLLAILVLLPLVIAGGYRVFPRTRIGRSVMHQDALPPPAPAAAPAPGARGSAWSDLRPSGVAEFGGIRYTVVTEGTHVVRGTPLVVAAVSENQIVVRPGEAAPAPEGPERSRE